MKNPQILHVILINTLRICIDWQRAMELNHNRFRSHCLAGKPIHRNGLLSILEEGGGVEPLTRNGHSRVQTVSPANLAAPSKLVPEVGFEPTDARFLKPLAMPIRLLRHGEESWIRTTNPQILSLLPIPI